MIALANNLTTLTLTYKQRRLLAEIIADVQDLNNENFIDVVSSLLNHHEKSEELDDLMKTIDPDENLF